VVVIAGVDFVPFGADQNFMEQFFTVAAVALYPCFFVAFFALVRVVIRAGAD
jgi:hypothetical protein